MNLVETVWQEKVVPQESVNFILIPIPKKGNLHMCDKWTGISFMEDMRKMVAGMIQNSLQELAER